MNTLHIDIKKLKSNATYILSFTLIFLILGCSVETNDVNEKVNETLMSKNWIRDSYVNKNSTGHFETYESKSELQFFSNGNLLIKEPQSDDNNGSGLIAPPIGFPDTLLINGTWTYFENTNTLTLKVDDSMSQKSTCNYINWKLTRLDNNQFEIENNDATEIIKVNFKHKI
ncbi:hypothetical protein [Confluentibacter flavum]|uniref:Lipocalin-like domain-containing protein n=1 Tax=Confluentibacter flavum TaxID=1909700 RepID=A0A2N3HH60_9FLAO|nr:hypothetical protein [Confluentibacter flavum]PKQ44138.1 hypothetical protein CSW08_15210 [Confluentibacter flavum]